MLGNPFTRRGDSQMLVVGMTGVKLGERFAQVGCAHGGRLAAVAKKVGLSGRAVAIVPDETAVERARRGAAAEGVLVEIELAPATRLPVEDTAFDLVVIDDTDGFLRTMPPADRAAAVRETLRILRPSGRVVVIGRAPRSGFGALWSREAAGPTFNAGPALEADGYRAVRTLAERERLVFVEGIKPR